MTRAAVIPQSGHAAAVSRRRIVARTLVSGLDGDGVEVLRGIAVAMSDDEIGEAIGTPRRRVARIRQRLVGVLGVKSQSPGSQRVELARLAFLAGLSSPWSAPE